MHASRQEGLVPAHWWAELGPGPLLGRPYSRDHISGCGLGVPLGSLSADGLGCIPLLVVWPEAFLALELIGYRTSSWC